MSNPHTMKLHELKVERDANSITERNIAR